VVIDNLDVISAIHLPPETHPPLITDANAVLPSSITPQRLQMVPPQTAEQAVELQRRLLSSFEECPGEHYSRQAVDGIFGRLQGFIFDF
jgi:hypothetical protein